MMVLLIFSLLLIFSVASKAEPQYSLSLNAAPAHVVVNHRHVYFTTANTIMILNEDLTVANKLQLERARSSANLLAMVPESDQRIVACFNDGSCSLATHSNQSNVVNQAQIYKSRMFAISSVFTGAVAGVKNCIFIGATGVFSNESETAELAIIKTSQYRNLLRPNFLFDVVQTFLITSKEFSMRSFVDVFHHGEYLYFLVKDIFINPSAQIVKLIRTTRRDGSRSFPLDLNYEVELQSDGGDGNFENIISMKLNEMLIVGLVHGKSSIFYSYSLSEVDHIIDATVKHCSQGNYEFSVPWSQDLMTCHNLKEMVSHYFI